MRRGLLAALLCLPLLAGAAPGAAAQPVSLCGSPTPVPSVAPPVDIAAALVFEFASDSFGIWTNEAGAATVTVARTATRAASVGYETGDGTLTAPGGYTQTAGTLRFAEGETSKTFTVPVSGAPGFFRVFLSNASNGGAVCPGSARPWGSPVRVHPTRPAGLILSPAGWLTVPEGGSASYTVKLNSRPAGGDVTVTVGGASGTDVTVDTDGGMAGDQNTLTFTTSNWHRPRTVTLRAREDTDGAWDSVTLTHTASGADYGSVTGTLFVAVNDNDGNTPLIEFTRDAIDTGEGLVAVVRVRKLGGGAATVDYATADGTATAPADYAAASGTLSFASGETEKTVTVAIVDHVAAEGEEHFTVTLSNPSGAALGPNRVATVRIKQPDFEFTSADYYVREDQGPAVISVRKIGPGAGEVEYLTIARGAPFATAPDDRSLVEGTLTFAAGETVKSFTVPIVDDGVVEPDEVFGVALRIRPLLGQLGKNRAFVTIRNHPPVPVIKFKSVSKSVREDEGTLTVTITKTGVGAATVDYETREYDDPPGTPGKATASADFTPVSGTLSFASGETEKTVTVPIVNDDVDEVIEFFYVSLTNPSGATLDPRSLGFPEINLFHITVNDDDPPPVIGFASGSHTVREGEGTVTVTVTKTGATVRDVTVQYATADGRAAAPGDYTETSGTLTFGPSETEKTIDIPLTNDNVAEDGEYFYVSLSSPDHATLDRNRRWTLVHMLDFDAPTSRQVEAMPPAVTISADRTSVTEGGDVTFTFTADPGPAGDLVVNVAADEEMGSGGDLVGSTDIRTVTIWAGTTSATWTLTTMSDDDDLADGTVTGRIVSGDGYTVGAPSKVTLALLDDDGGTADTDGAPEPTSVTTQTGLPGVDPALIAEVRALAGQTHHGTAHVTRWRRVLVAFGVETYPGLSPTTAGEAEANAKKYSSPLWPRIAGILAALEAAPEPQQQPVTLPEVSVAAGASPVYEGGDAVFTLTASPLPASPLAVSVTVAASGDYGIAGASRTVTIPTAGSVMLTLATADDSADEPDGSVTVTVNDGAGYTVGSSASGTVSVRDDDLPPPAVSITAAAASVTEGGAASFTVSADRAPDADLTVTLAVTEAAGSDHVAADDEGSRSVTIAKGGTRAVFSVPTVDDAVDEPDGSVTVTVNDGDGYTVGSSASGTVSVRDDDLPPPAVSITAAAASVTEGGAASFTVSADRAPDANLTVTLSVTEAAGGDHVAADDEGTATVTIAKGTTEAVFSVPTVDDAVDEPDGSVTVTVNDGAGYTVGASASGTVSVRDDDLPPPAVSIAAAAASVTEGGAASFTVSADRAPDADLTVTLSVTEAAGSDHVAADDEGTATVTIAKGATEAVFSVPTVDDAVDEPDGSVTVTVADGAGYTVSSSRGAATVAVSDDDAAAGPVLSVADATVKEGEGLMWFTIRLSAPSERPVTVHYRTRESTPVSARASVDYLANSWNLGFRAGETEKRVWVYIYDDSHDEEAETFEFVLWSASGAPIADAVGVGTIVNDDPMPAAWLARFGRTVAEQALDGIAGRMTADRTAGMRGSIAGQALSFDPAANDNPGSRGAGPGHAPDGAAVPGGTGALALADVAQAFGGQSDPGGFGHDAAGFANGTQSRTMTARDALLGSSFSLAGAADGSGASMAFWGRAAQGGFDGREGTFSLDGTVTTGILGADYARGKWLVGLALARSAGEGDYRDSDVSPRPDGQSCPDGVDSGLCNGAVRSGDGSVEASLTAAIPYAALQASERLKLWGAAGYGTGEVTLKTALGGSYKADTSWSMAAAGLRGELLAPPAPGSGSGAGSGSGPALAVTSDALWTRTSSEKTNQLAASESDATRIRLGLEGSYRMALEGGGSLGPKLEIGARHDGGDAETGFGVELGGGVAWTDPALGLSLDVSGRTLIAHGNDDLKDRGYAASLAFDPDPATGRGPSLSLRQEFGGQAQGGLDALFAPDPLEDRTGSEATSRWSMEAAYGFPAFGGRWTGSPHVGLGLATGARDYSLGWRLAPEGRTAANVSFGVKATRRESGIADPEHAAGIEIRATW